MLFIVELIKSNSVGDFRFYFVFILSLAFPFRSSPNLKRIYAFVVRTVAIVCIPSNKFTDAMIITNIATTNNQNKPIPTKNNSF